MTKDQLEILRHSIGEDAFGKVKGGRNYFVAKKSNTECLALVAAGMMAARSSALVCDDEAVYVVTERGAAEVAERREQRPRQTRSQERYTRFLDADCGMSFGEWLRSGGGQ